MLSLYCNWEGRELNNLSTENLQSKQNQPDISLMALYLREKQNKTYNQTKQNPRYIM